MIEYQNNNPIVSNDYSISSNTLLSKVFFRMFLGLLATAFAAGYVYYSGALESLVLNGGLFVFLIAELVLAVVLSLGIKKFSPGVATALFFGYSIVSGVTFSTIFIMFELSSIVYAFVGTAAIFGILAYIGKTTKADLTNMGTILGVTLIIAIIISIVNIFIGNSLLDIIMDWVILAIFMGYTVYDINKILKIQERGYAYLNEDNLYIYGAFQLYLDFINMFIRILQLFGKRRN